MTVASTLMEWWFGKIDEKAAQDILGVETFAKLKSSDSQREIRNLFFLHLCQMPNLIN